jgi:hypothetical protein
MSQSALQAAFSQAQQALIDLSTGVKEATASYAIGGETRSVTYSRTNVADARRLLQELQRALGMPAGGRTLIPGGRRGPGEVGSHGVCPTSPNPSAPEGRRGIQCG